LLNRNGAFAIIEATLVDRELRPERGEDAGRAISRNEDAQNEKAKLPLKNLCT